MLATGQPFTVPDFLAHLALPALTLALFDLGSLVRYTRASMLEVLNQDYIRTARAKGLSERQVVFGHALRNALNPLITQVGLALPRLLGGAVVIETVFQWPGMGRLAIQAILQRDYPVLMGLNLMIALLVIAGSLLADVLYSVADPRIRYS
jgi:peptide/nickel transport system permease protein